MGDIDRKRYAAVRALEGLGAVWKDGAWQDVPEVAVRGGFLAAAEALYQELVGYCEEFAGAPEGSELERDFERLMDLLQVYEAERAKLGL